MKKFSLSIKLVLVVVPVLLLNVVFLWVFSSLFMESYYTNHKKNELIGAFNSLAQVYSHMDNGNTLAAISAVEDKNITVAVYGLISPGDIKNVFYPFDWYIPLYSSSNPSATQVLYKDTFVESLEKAGGMFTIPQSSSLVMDLINSLGNSTMMFITRQATAVSVEKLSLFGYFTEDTVLLIQTPIEPIHESAMLATRFSVIIGLIALGIGTIITVILSSLLTRPVREMTKVAGNLAKLDFSQRVSVSSKDEIGELGESINTMTDALVQYTEDLNDANSQMKRDIEERRLSEEAQKMLVSNISHELKTPISIISGYAEGLKGGLAADEQSRDEYCDVILEESRNMTHMIQNLLRLAKLQSGHMKLIYTEVSFADLTAKLFSSLSLETQKKRLTVKNLCGGDLYARADKDCAEQVLRNFVINAVRHTPEEGSIVVSTRVFEERVRLEVYNSGSFVEEGKETAIWSSFYRGDTARSRDNGEVGLGLAIVKAHMLSHGMPFGTYNTPEGVVFYADFEMYTAQS